MARGKQTCKILKEIRRQIAEANGIEFITSECRYKRDCLGTCPKCEAEVRYLEQQLRAHQHMGKAVTLAGISAGMILMSGCSGSSSNQSSYTLQGEPVETVEQVEATDTIEEGEMPAIEDTVVLKKGEIDDTELVVAGEIIDSEQEDKVYETIVDVRPTFPGGDEKLMEWISQHLQYPQNADNSVVQGRVVVRFLVKEDGSVGDAKVIRAIHPAFDAEALRVIKSLPKFNPAILNGKTIEYWFTVSVLFRLQGPDEPTCDNITNIIYSDTDKLPTFPGGIKKLMQFLASNIKYPKEWDNACVNGKVIAKLEIDKLGTIGNIEILRCSLPDDFSEEAINEVHRIVKLLPKFIPAQKDGKPVKSYYILPISFKLSDYVYINESNSNSSLKVAGIKERVVVNDSNLAVTQGEMPDQRPKNSDENEIYL